MEASLKNDVGGSGSKTSPPFEPVPESKRVTLLRSIALAQQEANPKWGSYEHGTLNGLLFAIGIMEGRRVMKNGQPIHLSFFWTKAMWFGMGWAVGATLTGAALWLVR